MKQHLDCRIVEDLLPNYIENLTNDYTNKDVEEHLTSCEECSELLNTMKADISVQNKAPEKEIKFLKKMNRTRVVAGAACILIAVLLSYMIYYSEFTYTGHKNDLSTAITEYASESGRSVEEAQVLETEQVDDVLIAFFKDSSNPEVYGFARFVKGFNNRYRIISTSYRPTSRSAVVQHHEINTESGRYFVIGGHNVDESIDSYGFILFNADHTQREDRLSYTVNSEQFLDVLKVSEMVKRMEELQEHGEGSLYFSRFPILLDEQGNDITSNYSLSSENDEWSSGSAKAEQFLIYLYISMIMAIGAVFTWYFWSLK